MYTPDDEEEGQDDGESTEREGQSEIPNMEDFSTVSDAASIPDPKKKTDA